MKVLGQDLFLVDLLGVNLNIAYKKYLLGEMEG